MKVPIFGNRLTFTTFKLYFKLCLFIFSFVLSSAKLTAEDISPLIELINIPTAEVIDQYGYQINLRLYKSGGVVTRFIFGVFNRVNLGVSWDIKQLIGTDRLQLYDPQLYVKVRLYDGSSYIPSLSFGFDRQGYNFNDTLAVYQYREKGIFLVSTFEVIAGLELHLGFNVYDFIKDKIFAFVGWSYHLGDRVATFMELDNLHNLNETRVNWGLRLFINPELHSEISVIDLVAKEPFAERIFRLGYGNSIKKK